MDLKSMIVNRANMAILYLNKYSPQILLGLGIIGGVATTITACTATLKIDGVLEETEDDLKRVKDNKSDEYSEDDRRHDLAVIYARRAIGLGRLFLPTAFLGTLSIGAILTSHGIMSRRQAAITAAYAVMQQAYASYRLSIKEKYGEDIDTEHSIAEYPAATFVEEGNVNILEDVEKDSPKTLVLGEERLSDGRLLPPFAKVFRRSNRWYQTNIAHNVFFLTMQENYANQRLRANGHLFLNDLYVTLGLQPTREGQLFGWLYDPKLDTQISFGLDKRMNPSYADFCDGRSDEVGLIFNVEPETLYNRI